ncbi:MAG: hypothetical protein ACHQAR_04395 [Steroidobacterales bacterium]
MSTATSLRAAVLAHLAALALVGTLMLPARPAVAQDAASLEPAVRTSDVPPSTDSQPSPQSRSTTPTAAALKPGGAAAPEPAAARRANGAAHTSTSIVAAPPATKGPKASDRLELQASQITGNRELPRVMYVVPWRKPDLGQFAGRPPNSLLDEVLAPVDRDVFRRQNRYYAALQPDTTPAAPAAAPAAAGTSGKDEK